MAIDGWLFARLIAALILTCAVVPAWAAPGGCQTGAAGATTGLAIGPTGRKTAIHMPTGYDPARPAPLVILLHGSGGWGAQLLHESGMDAASDRHGFVVAAPDAGIVAEPGFFWNIPGVATAAGTLPPDDAPDDVAHVLMIIDRLAAQGCIDPARVYAAGLSGGGRMASWLGCVAPERFAAIAPVVGLRAGHPDPANPEQPDPATCQPKRPLPIIAFAGDRDSTNPITGGGMAYWRYSMQAAEQRWATLNGCTAEPETRRLSPVLYEKRYSGCAADAVVLARVTVGGAHEWIADNDAMWQFLSRYRR